MSLVDGRVALWRGGVPRPRTARRAMLRYANSIVLRERIARYHLRRRLRPHYHNNARVTPAVDTTRIQ